MFNFNKLPAVQVALLQTLGLIAYVVLIDVFVMNGEKLFGKIPNFPGPILFLTLFLTSALITGSIALLYPAIVVWEHKNIKRALTIVGYETLFMAIASITFMLIVLVF